MLLLTERWRVAFATALAPLFFAGAGAGVLYGQSGQIVITSAASFQRGLPPKGSISSAFCTGLQVQGVIYATTKPLPFTLEGISVAVGGAQAPILAVADGGGYQQINFEVPQEAVPNSDGTWTVTASQGGVQLTTQAASLQSPGDFFWVGTNLAAFQHAADYSLVSEQNPAHPGEVLIGYLTGLPGTQPVVPTGAASPFSPLAIVPQPNTTALVDQFALLFNGTVVANSCPVVNSPCQQSNLLWLGLTPAAVGLYQLNFIVPPSIAPGNVAIQLQRSTCATISGEPCGGMGAPFVPNGTAGCISLGGGGTREVCTGSTVPLPIR
jgi:uncharacterized protein (TIGR03437 family)